MSAVTNPFESDASPPPPSLDSQRYPRHGAIVDAHVERPRAGAREADGQRRHEIVGERPPGNRRRIEVTLGLDFRVGGREHGRFRRDDGPETRNETIYLDIVPHRRIVMAYTMAIDGANISASLGTVEFESLGVVPHNPLEET